MAITGKKSVDMAEIEASQLSVSGYADLQITAQLPGTSASSGKAGTPSLIEKVFCILPSLLYS